MNNCERPIVSNPKLERKGLNKEFISCSLGKHNGEVKTALYFQKHWKIVSYGLDSVIKIWDVGKRECELEVFSTTSSFQNIIKLDEDTFLYPSDYGEIGWYSLTHEMKIWTYCGSFVDSLTCIQKISVDVIVCASRITLYFLSLSSKKMIGIVNLEEDNDENFPNIIKSINHKECFFINIRKFKLSFEKMKNSQAFKSTYGSHDHVLRINHKKFQIEKKYDIMERLKWDSCIASIATFINKEGDEILLIITDVGKISLRNTETGIVERIVNLEENYCRKYRVMKYVGSILSFDILLLGDGDGMLSFLDLNQFKIVSEGIKTHDEAISHVELISNLSCLTSSKDGKVNIVDFRYKILSENEHSDLEERKKFVFGEYIGSNELLKGGISDTIITIAYNYVFGLKVKVWKTFIM